MIKTNQNECQINKFNTYTVNKIIFINAAQLALKIIGMYISNSLDNS